MDELFDVGLAFSKCPLPTGRNLAIITNAGGGGVLSVDAMERYGLELVKFDEETNERLKAAVPEEGSIKNPIDVLGDAPVIRYKESLEAVLDSDDVDGLVMGLLKHLLKVQVSLINLLLQLIWVDLPLKMQMMY